MYRKSALLLLLFSLFVLSGHSQAVLSGIVRDAQTNETLIGVSVHVEGLKTGTATDGKGKYSINLPAGEFTVQVSYIGYVTAEKKVTITNKNQQLNVRLNANEQELEEVVVTSRKQDVNDLSLTKSVKHVKWPVTRNHSVRGTGDHTDKYRPSTNCQIREHN